MPRKAPPKAASPRVAKPKGPTPKSAPTRNAKASSPTAPTRFVAYIAVSLDGFIADPSGGVGWLDPYMDAAAGFSAFMKSVRAAVMGRATYDFTLNHPGAHGSLPCYVLTHRPLAPAPHVIPHSGDVTTLADRIRREVPGDVWLAGGGVVLKAFLEADLVDIWRLFIIPAALGDGIPLLPRTSFVPRHLSLTGTHAFKSGVVELDYERQPPRRTKQRT